MRDAKIIGVVALTGTMLGQTASSAPEQAAAGTIEGQVRFEGSPPPPTIIESGSQPVLYVDRSGGLRYAVVFLPDAQASTSAIPAAATMGQRDFIFEPQVLAVRSGQIVRFTNDDPANHNVRAQDANPSNTFSINTASGSIGPTTHRFAATSGRPIQLSCDIHPWMAAWIYVFDHEQFVVTNAEGTFRIPKAPAGHYRLAVRQPAARLARDLAVSVRPQQTTHVDVRFTSADMALPSR